MLLELVQTTMHLNEAIEEICRDANNEKAKLNLLLATKSTNKILDMMKVEWDA